MNKRGLQKSVGNLIRLRPVAIRETIQRERLESEDDKWYVANLSDENVQLSNTRTGHRLELGLDHIREFRTPDYFMLHSQVILKGQEVVVEPLVIPSMDTNLTRFEELLGGVWQHQFIKNKEIWVSGVDYSFQMELGESRESTFKEPWTLRFPNNEDNRTCPVYLKVNDVVVKELTFVSCDEGRYILPLPTIVLRGETRIFRYVRSSLEYKVAKIIGKFYTEPDLDGAAKYCRIEVVE